MPQLTEIQQFKITLEQKQTLSILRTKYHYNTSQFIRDAIKDLYQKQKEG